MLTVNEIMKQEKRVLKEKRINIIVAPAGSGKTYYIFNSLLNKSEKSIYLCDTSNLKEAILKDENYFERTESSKGLKANGFDLSLYNCTVMTYAEYFYRYKNYKKIKTIICDEIHNLFKYKDKFDDEEHQNYGEVIKLLKEISKKGVNIIGFTATVKRIREKEMSSFFERNCCDNTYNLIDLSNRKDIKRLKEKEIKVFYDIRQINNLFEKNQLFKDSKKCLIYTDRITRAKEIELHINQNIKGLKAVSLWSLNNKDNPMSIEQLKVRKNILESGLIPKEYNILIINSSYETGINIKDDSVEIVIVNNINIDTIIQARSRIRKNIELLMYRVPRNKRIKTPEIEVPSKYLNKNLNAIDKKSLIETMGLINSKGKVLGWTTFKKILNFNKYLVLDKKIKVEGKQTRVSEIRQMSI